MSKRAVTRQAFLTYCLTAWGLLSGCREEAASDGTGGDVDNQGGQPGSGGSELTGTGGIEPAPSGNSGGMGGATASGGSGNVGSGASEGSGGSSAGGQASGGGSGAGGTSSRGTGSGGASSGGNSSGGSSSGGSSSGGAGSGGSPWGGLGGGGPGEYCAYEMEFAEGHTHLLHVSTEDVVGGVGGQFTLMGGDHSHTITLSAADLDILAAGGSVTKQSSFTGGPAHSHSTTVHCDETFGG